MKLMMRQCWSSWPVESNFEQETKAIEFDKQISKTIHNNW